MSLALRLVYTLNFMPNRAARLNRDRQLDATEAQLCPTRNWDARRCSVGASSGVAMSGRRDSGRSDAVCELRAPAEAARSRTDAQMQRYTDTQIHRHTNTQTHKYSDARLPLSPAEYLTASNSLIAGLEFALGRSSRRYERLMDSAERR